MRPNNNTSNLTRLELATAEASLPVTFDEFQIDEAGSEYLFVLPVIVIVGLCGNIVSMVTILNTRLRRITANQYLIVLTASDSVFLLGMIMIIFKMDYWSYHACKMIEYLLMTSSYVSSWSVVALTIERYIAIAHPIRHFKLSHIPRTKIMRYWVPIPFFLNLIQFITLTPNTHDPAWPNVRQCSIASGQLQMITEMSDVFLSYVAPCIIVILLNSIIASTVYRAGKGLLNDETTKCTSTTTTSEHLKSRAPQRRTGNTNSGSTRILLVVPVVYTLLNTPFYLMRILETLALNLFNSHAFSTQELSENKLAVFFYNVAHYLYYINFASDFLVYAFSSANFRKSVCLAWSKLLCPSWKNQQKVMRQVDLSSQRTFMLATTSHYRNGGGDPV